MADTMRVTLAYKNSSQKRTYDLDIEQEFINDAKAKAIAINESLQAGSASSFASFFVDNNGNTLEMIESLKHIKVTEEIIDLGGGE